MKFLSDLKRNDLRNKTCLLRVDLNILEADLRGFFNNRSGLTRILPFRIEAVLPTIKFLISEGAKAVILSHRGRPAVPLKRGISKRFSLKPFVKILSSLLKKPVNFISFNELGLINKTKQKIQKAKAGSVFLAENLRLFPEEEKNDAKFAENLASLGDFYINDAFSVSHRKNASVVAITKFLPSYAGLLLEKEIKNLNRVAKNQKNPFVVILGGAKISDKISLLNSFQKSADCFLIGGGIAHNFLLAWGLPIGDSIFEKSTVDFAKKMLKNKSVVLPVDYAIEKRKILDIGPNTIKMYSDIIKKAKTIIWNGPMGQIENPKFANGSKEIAKAIIKNKKAFAVIGGGETIASLKIKNQKNNLFISTGGGAMLEYLAAKKLPGLEALK